MGGGGGVGFVNVRLSRGVLDNKSHVPGGCWYICLSGVFTGKTYACPGYVQSNRRLTRAYFKACPGGCGQNGRLYRGDFTDCPGGYVRNYCHLYGVYV